MKLNKRIRAVTGGTSASKTISILLVLIDAAQRDKKPTLTSIVSESFPHLGKGVERDFKNILQEQGYWKDSRWNGTSHTYTFETGSQIEFFSADQADKFKGPRRDRLFGNEINNWKNGLESFNQMEVRTKEYVFLDWNPTAEFWFYTEILPSRDDVDFITLTYLDNEACPEEIRKSIERRKGNKRWWQVYGLGQLGEAEGKVYTNWEIIDSVPEEAELIRRGLDFGYTNDPTAVVDVYKWNGGYILDEVIYEKGLSNRVIAQRLEKLAKIITVADSAEPKSIDEISLYGVPILPATKGPGSINQGVQLIQDKKIYITKRSVNGIKEYRSYYFKTDKDGKVTNYPEEGNDHFLDAVRYAFRDYFGDFDVKAVETAPMEKISKYEPGGDKKIKVIEINDLPVKPLFDNTDNFEKISKYEY